MLSQHISADQDASAKMAPYRQFGKIMGNCTFRPFSLSCGICRKCDDDVFEAFNVVITELLTGFTCSCGHWKYQFWVWPSSSSLQSTKFHFDFFTEKGRYSQRQMECQEMCDYWIGVFNMVIVDAWRGLVHQMRHEQLCGWLRQAASVLLRP